MKNQLIYIVTIFVLLLFLVFLAGDSWAGTTGKITGKITDAESGEPLPMVNVIIEGTTMGAATDLKGDYIILRVPPGVYTLKASMLGYKQVRYENVRVSIDLTTTLDFQLGSEVLAGEEVTIVAERPMVTKDLTATTAVMGAEQIAALPVTEVNEAIELQAGLVKDADGGMHIRGGRKGEISYWIDGIPVTDVFDGGTVVEVNKDMVQELQVVSGAFNAEYGQAMSGIVNIATKGGDNQFGGNFTTYIGDHVSDHKREFMHIDNIDPIAIRNFDGSIHGAIVKDKLFYYLNSRYIYFDGWLDGQRRYNPGAVTFQIAGIPTDTLKRYLPEYMSESRVYDKENDLRGFVYVLGSHASLDSFFTYDYLDANDIDSDSFSVYYERIRETHKNGKGDGKYVPMNWNRKIYTQGKLIYKPFPSLTLSYNFIYDDVDYQEWNGIDNERDYKYNPDGAPKKFRTGMTNIVKLTHLLSSRTFYEMGFSYFSKNAEKYNYKNINDARYVHPDMAIQMPFSYKTAGTEDTEIDPNNPLAGRRYERETTTFIGKLDLTSQITKKHQIKSGVEFRRHEVFRKDFILSPIEEHITRDFIIDGSFINTRILPDSSIFHSHYKHQPKEFSVYLQDKMEFKNMIVNVGLRLDYFKPDGRVLADGSDPNIYDPIKPENRYKDYGTDGIPNTYDADGTEGNGIRDAGEAPVTRAERETYWFKDASSKIQLGPRLGVSFPITDRGVIHFSYGHFFQLPRFERLYQNPDFELESGTGNIGVVGNADLKPEQTINGEIGLQQQLTDDISLEVTGYFRDIRDLAGTSAEEVILYGGFAKYSKIINSDFGFVRGVIIALDKRFSGGFSASVDYTLQIAKGSNSDPEQARNALAGGALPEVQITSLNWDQKHTINAAISYAGKNWGGSIISQWGSGLPYTPRRSEDISSLLTNSQRRPGNYNVDLRAYKDFKFGLGTLTLFMRVFNLFDTLNEIHVYDDTGRADFTTDEAQARKTDPLELINTLDDWYTNSRHFSEPRRVELGLTFMF